MTALTLSGVTKAFGSAQVLRGVDLHVPARTLTAVLGPSGCGKTTLLRLVAGFDDPDAGTIALGGETVVGAGRPRPPQHRRVGLRAAGGRAVPAPVGRRERRLRAGPQAALGAAGSASCWSWSGCRPALAARHPHELSGGQQQRVALARALAPRPSIVLLDEPFSSLDAGLRESTRRAVADALAAAEATAVLVTHDQAEALSLADQVAVMRHGRLVQLAAPETVYRSPSDAGVAGFVGEAVLLPASVSDGYATCELGSLAVRACAAPCPARPGSCCGPEQLLLSDGGAGRRGQGPRRQLLRARRLGPAGAGGRRHRGAGPGGRPRPATTRLAGPADGGRRGARLPGRTLPRSGPARAGRRPVHASAAERPDPHPSGRLETRDRRRRAPPPRSGRSVGGEAERVRPAGPGLRECTGHHASRAARVSPARRRTWSRTSWPG